MRPVIAIAVVGALALAAGCGADDPPYIGDWVASDGVCTRDIAFRSDGSTSASSLCQLDDGSKGVEVAVGRYVESSGVLSISAQKATCSGEQKGTYLTWSVAGDVLTIRDTAGTATFQRAAPISTGQATLGCFASDGTFTPSPLAPL